MWRVAAILLLLVIQGGNTEKKVEERLNKNGVGMAMQLCNKKCNCSQKTIECGSMKSLWGLVNAGSKYTEEFAGFTVVVSDNDLKTIDNGSFVMKSENSNGLEKIKALTLKKFTKLKFIQADFFEKHFPDLEYLTGI